MLQTHTHALPRGTRLSQYEITGILGSGGFGITYLARDSGLDAPVAIKEYLPSELATRVGASRVTAISSHVSADFRWGLERFLDEARILAKFRHPNIVHVFQIFEANNTAYIVMEYASGPSLSQHLEQKGALSEAETRGILLPVMDGLKRIHERGFLHRDIKPGNIILRDEGGPALIDFGAARHAIGAKSRSITSIVTEGYAPLEQYDPNGNQGPWTDLYALGAVAYKCLTGKTPPAATSRVRKDALTPLDAGAPRPVGKNLANALQWALAVYEEDRPQSVDDLIAAMAGQAGSAAPVRVKDPEATQLLYPKKPTAPTPAASTGTSGVPPIAWIAGGIVGLALLVALFVSLFFGSRNSAPRPAPATAGQQALHPPDLAHGGVIAAQQCAQCHDWTSTGLNRVGPSLYRIAGAPLASRPDFSYSPALQRKGGRWDDNMFNRYLTNPQAAVPGTSMAFAGLSNPQDVADLIAFMKSWSGSPIITAPPSAAPLPSPAAPARALVSQQPYRAQSSSSPVESARPSTPPAASAGNVQCILPSGDEVQLPQAECRQRSGVIDK
jgi:serine/threonine protein kinase/cytochrome c2